MPFPVSGMKMNVGYGQRWRCGVKVQFWVSSTPVEAAEPLLCQQVITTPSWAGFLGKLPQVNINCFIKKKKKKSNVEVTSIETILLERFKEKLPGNLQLLGLNFSLYSNNNNTLTTWGFSLILCPVYFPFWTNLAFLICVLDTYHLLVLKPSHKAHMLHGQTLLSHSAFKYTFYCAFLITVPKNIHLLGAVKPSCEPQATPLPWNPTKPVASF